MDILDCVFVLQLHEEEDLAWHQRLHEHKKNQFEVHYFLEGEGSFFTNKKKYSIRENQVYVTSELTQHKITADKDSFISYYAVLMEFDDADRKLIEYLNQKGPITLYENKRFFFEWIKDNGLSKNTNLRLSSCHKLLGFLYSIDQNYEEEESINVAVENALKYMRMHLFDTISLEELANYVSLNPIYFNRLFCKKMNFPPIKYFSLLKLEAARSLLATTSLSIKEIAAKLNYNSQFHFSKCFKDNTGFSPSIYRKTHYQIIGEKNNK
ncbi:MAG: helix-turn-helix domain-containing protein [Pleomorphochaeta sp.]